MHMHGRTHARTMMGKVTLNLSFISVHTSEAEPGSWPCDSASVDVGNPRKGWAEVGMQDVVVPRRNPHT